MSIRSLSIVALVVVTGPARAEINFGECIEWVVADSERVVVGKITRVEPAREHQIVTVEVLKTIRGKHEAKVRFVVRGPGESAQDWMKAKVPMLFCLVKREQIKENKDLPEHDLFLRQGANTYCAVFLGKSDQHAMDVFTRDFGELTDPAAIIKYVETCAKTIPADWKKKHVTVDLPFDTPAMKKLYAGSAVEFTLPADATLEAQGGRWCKSKHPDERSRGIRVLEAFPTEENIRILKGLLTDDAYTTGDGKKSYYVRARAYNVLRKLGVRVERPVLDEPSK